MMIRIAEEADVPQILAIYAPYILETTHTFEYDVPSGAEFLQRFREITRQFPWLVWEEDGEILGYAHGCAPFQRAAYQWCSETGIYLRPEARGRGIGRRLYTALEKILIFQGYCLNYVLITAENEASLEFHRALGYEHRAELKKCGYKFGRWLDVVWMDKMLNFVSFPSNPPADWLSIRHNAQKISYILDILSLS
ncbi:MAG: N-acetyltransferase [Oscillospiraceae bacterium]|nr:N-acetyltransferase [Oscillospiraceae bacterium]